MCSVKRTDITLVACGEMVYPAYRGAAAKRVKG